MSEDNDFILNKLNFYSLKHQEAQLKFNAAFTHQKRFQKAVTRMRYEFTNRLSVEDKKLLDQARFKLSIMLTM